MPAGLESTIPVSMGMRGEFDAVANGFRPLSIELLSLTLFSSPTLLSSLGKTVPAGLRGVTGVASRLVSPLGTCVCPLLPPNIGKPNLDCDMSGPPSTADVARLRLRRQTTASNARMAKPATAPTTAPAIAPALLPFPPFEASLALADVALAPALAPAPLVLLVIVVFELTFAAKQDVSFPWTTVKIAVCAVVSCASSTDPIK